MTKLKVQMTEKALVLGLSRDVVRGSCPPQSYGRRVSLVRRSNGTTLEGRTTGVWSSVAEIATHFSGARNDTKEGVFVRSEIPRLRSEQAPQSLIQWRW
jgi:hypothetical protein